MSRILLLALLAAAPLPAAPSDELGEAPTPWSAADRAEFLRSCATLHLAPALCECFLEPLQAHFPTYDAFQRNRDPAKDRTADLELQRCAERFGKEVPGNARRRAPRRGRGAGATRAAGAPYPSTLNRGASAHRPSRS